jgi:hypothetical protein
LSSRTTTTNKQQKQPINNNKTHNSTKKQLITTKTKQSHLFKSYFVSLCEQLDGVARAVEPISQEGPPDAEMVEANVSPWKNKGRVVIWEMARAWIPGLFRRTFRKATMVFNLLSLTPYIFVPAKIKV